MQTSVQILYYHAETNLIPYHYSIFNSHLKNEVNMSSYAFNMISKSQVISISWEKMY